MDPERVGKRGGGVAGWVAIIEIEIHAPLPLYLGAVAWGQWRAVCRR